MSQSNGRPTAAKAGRRSPGSSRPTTPCTTCHADYGAGAYGRSRQQGTSPQTASCACARRLLAQKDSQVLIKDHHTYFIK